MTTTFTITSMGKGFYAIEPYPGPLEAGAEVHIVHGARAGSYDIVFDGNCYGRVRHEEALVLHELEEYLGVHLVEGRRQNAHLRVGRDEVLLNGDAGEDQRSLWRDVMKRGLDIRSSKCLAHFAENLESEDTKRLLSTIMPTQRRATSHSAAGTGRYEMANEEPVEEPSTETGAEASPAERDCETGAEGSTSNASMMLDVGVSSGSGDPSQ
ncbi:hypothetical protein B484DRAFT_436018, partial [Ochromonadaceae sp. CCMP2298]